MRKIAYEPIGIIHSPFKEPEGAPIQPAGASGVRGTVSLNTGLAPGLKDLDGFSHIILVYHFHLSQGYTLDVIPFLDDRPRGVFATRAPKRPNPVGMSVVRLLSIEGAELIVEGVDVLDGTPQLDIKPFVPRFDAPPVDRIGWLTGKGDAVEEVRSDERFR